MYLARSLRGYFSPTGHCVFPKLRELLYVNNLVPRLRATKKVSEVPRRCWKAHVTRPIRVGCVLIRFPAFEAESGFPWGAHSDMKSPGAFELILRMLSNSGAVKANSRRCLWEHHIGEAIHPTNGRGSVCCFRKGACIRMVALQISSGH